MGEMAALDSDLRLDALLGLEPGKKRVGQEAINRVKHTKLETHCQSHLLQEWTDERVSFCVVSFESV